MTNIIATNFVWEQLNTFTTTNLAAEEFLGNQEFQNWKLSSTLLQVI